MRFSMSCPAGASQTLVCTQQQSPFVHVCNVLQFVDKALLLLKRPTGNLLCRADIL